MTESNYFEVNCTREVKEDAFARGVQDYVFCIGAPNCWVPSKSYFRIDMSIYQNGTILPLKPSDLSCFSDNAAGNLFDNTYVRSGQQDISNIVQSSAQASALDVRLNNTLPWLKSMGSATAVNESSFVKRLASVSSNPNPYAALNYLPQITVLDGPSEKEVFFPAEEPTPGTGASETKAEVEINVNTNVVIGSAGGLATPAATLFETGMPQVVIATSSGVATGFPQRTNGSVQDGDIIVIRGIPYTITNVVDEQHLEIASNHVAGIAATTDWFIMRGDVIRSKQASSSVYAIWQPPIGLFKYDEELGAGEYRIQLNPNSNYQLTAAETRDKSINAALRPYQIVINSVKFYAYIEKKHIPDTIKELYLSDMMVQSKPYNSNLQFSVPPSTTALTIFLQDENAGQNAQIPPSMFKCLDYTDLSLQNIQVTYANITKPSTNWDSAYGVAISNAYTFSRQGLNKLEQRYHDSYEESGMDIKLGGHESFYDYLQRGPFYHYSFDRAENNKATEVQITSNYNQDVSSKRLFIVAHYRKTIQITTANGLVVDVKSREV